MARNATKNKIIKNLKQMFVYWMVELIPEVIQLSVYWKTNKTLLPKFWKAKLNESDFFKWKFQ